mgnify:CR=1 FL=1
MTTVTDTTAEKREIEFDLIVDASSYGHTDAVQRIAETAVHAALVSFENGEHGDLLLNAGRAALIATTAALQALEDGGHLVPEGTSTTVGWRAVTDDGHVLTTVLEADEFRDWMVSRGLREGEHVEAHRTVVVPIPREVTALHEAPADDDF